MTLKPKFKNLSSGFSLVELLITVAIIGIVAGIATMKVSGYVRQGKTTEAKVMLSNLYNTEKIYKLEHGHYHYDLTKIRLQLTGKYLYNVGFSETDPVAGSGTTCPTVETDPPGCEDTGRTNYNIKEFCDITFEAGNDECMLDSTETKIQDLTDDDNKCKGSNDAKITKTTDGFTQFQAMACADLGGSKFDVWTIDYRKDLKQTHDGTQ